MNRFIAASLFFLTTSSLLSLELTRAINLQGKWLFEIGDNLEYAAPDFNDNRWKKIRVPGTWENDGFPGYDGYAWYRTSFIVPRNLRNKILFVRLGQIDDVDRCYFNGHLIGGWGDFPTKNEASYKTAYNIVRTYEIPANFIQFGGRNCLAVRVYDHQGSGGIVHGDIGLYSCEDALKLKYDLSGSWRFKPGDDLQWAAKEFADTGWRTIAVPGLWDQQGFPKINGWAWYRKTFKMDNIETDGKLMLVLGKIKEMDQVFLNGVQIGETGVSQADYEANSNGYHNTERTYFFPTYLIQANAFNTIAIRVYESCGKGGIYTGHIGICTHDELQRRSRKVQ